MIDESKYPVNNTQDNQGGCCSKSSCCGGSTPIRRTQPKVGRNTPCPCGSGHKFKKMLRQELS